MRASLCECAIVRVHVKRVAIGARAGTRKVAKT